MTRRLALPLLPTMAIALALALVPAAADARIRPCVAGSGGGPKCHVKTAKVRSVADGDTISVRVGGQRKRRGLRITGIQAMELTNYGRDRAGECHSVAATRRLAQIIRAGRRVVRIASQKRGARTGTRGRLRRSIAVRVGGHWVDPAAVLLSEGLALWLPHPVEWAWNRRYSRLAQRAALRGVGMWNTAACRFGPQQEIPISMKVKWDANGTDGRRSGGEWVRIWNHHPAAPLSLRRWWLRDSNLRRYRLPVTAVVPPGRSIRVFVGRGRNTLTKFHWPGLRRVFENVRAGRRQMGDGAYLFDRHGDLRAWVQYPCRVRCADSLRGKLRVRAHARSPEHITVRNVSSVAVDLSEAEIESVPWFYEFSRGTVLLPGQRFKLFVRRRGLHTRLRVGWGFRKQLLTNRGDVVTLRNRLGAPVACHAWGRARCPRA